jgi:hypothetical protein
MNAATKLLPAALRLLACLLLAPLVPDVARAADVVVGVNLVNAPYDLTIPEQETILNAMHAAGVRVIRGAIPGEKGTGWAERASAHGIRIEWLVDAAYAPGTPWPHAPNGFNGLWKAPPLSKLDPDRFRAYFEPILATLEAHGIALAGFEFLNGFNWAGFNADFPLPGQGRVFGASDLLKDPEGQLIARVGCEGYSTTTGRASTIVGLVPGDRIDLTGLSFTTTGTVTPGAGNVLPIVENGQTVTLQLDPTASFSGDIFRLTQDATTGTEVTVACFAAGTQLLTAHGPVAVEALAVGDLMATVLQGRLAPVRWLGHRGLNLRAHPRPHEVMPIRIARNAFGADMPVRDLFVSPDHAIYIDGVLIPARHLVNGTSITGVAADEVTYWHVELDCHDVLLAEGLPCESYLDTGNRAAFANGGRSTELHPDFAAWRRDAAACAPLVVTSTVLDAVRGRLIERAGIAQPTASPADNPAPPPPLPVRAIQ